MPYQRFSTTATIFTSKNGGVCEKIQDWAPPKYKDVIIEFRDSQGNIFARQEGQDGKQILTVDAVKPVVFTDADGRDKTIENLTAMLAAAGAMSSMRANADRVAPQLEITGNNPTVMHLFNTVLLGDMMVRQGHVKDGQPVNVFGLYGYDSNIPIVH